LTELQYKQVLDNLAMYQLDPNAVPWLVALKNGSTQVGDTGSVGVLLDIGADVITHPSLNANRSIVDQWGTVPVTDDTTLKLLRMAYQTALGRPRFLSAPEANDLGHGLSQQIGTNADISTDADTLRALVSIYGEGLKPRATTAGELPPAIDSQSPGIDTVEERTLSVDAYKRARQAVKVYRELDNMITNTLDEPFLVDDPSNRPMFKLKGEASSGLAKETARRVNVLQAELTKIASLPPGWYHVGCKKDVPKDACYVGHYKACGRECYVWVNPQGRAALADFTLSVLKLSSVFQATQVLTVPSGIQFSPALTRPVR
jgi:hypothetical protein